MTKSRRKFLFAIDILLVGLFLLVLAPRLTGLPTHEWLGIAISIPVLVHLVLSWRWVEHVATHQPSALRGRSRLNIALNVLLFMLVVVVIASGVGISVVALPVLHLATVDDRAWRAVHNQTESVLLVVLGLHIAMNWTSLRHGLTRWRTHD